MVPTACPPESELLAFHHGELPEAQLDRVGDHIETCDSCAARLEHMERAEPVLSALRAQRSSPDTLRDEADRVPLSPHVPGYELLGELGAGGMGVVYKARHCRLGRLVALKRLKAGSVDDHARFRREAETIAALEHVNVVQIFDVGEHRGEPYLALEFVPGGSLDAYAQGKPQDPHEAAALVETLARAMQHAHERGVVHRDLKPANILLRADAPLTKAEDRPRLGACTPKIGDFGIAKRLDLGPDGPTRTGAVLGTPSYMAPEQAASGTVGPAADVYALGAILYELLTGRPPFQGGGTLETLRQVVQDDPVPPSRLRPGLPRDLETIALACLRKDPSRRYHTAAELADDLRRYLEGRPVRARRASLPEVAWKWSRRHRGVALGAVIAQAALIVLLGGFAWYNARLRDSLEATRVAEDQAEANARLALEAHEQLVRKVQSLLEDSPRTRPLRRSLLETAISGLERVTGTAGPVHRPSQAVAHELLGEIHWQLGRTPEAIDALGKGRALAAAVLAGAPRNADARNDLARICRRLGAVHLRREEPAKARDLFREAVEVAEAWRADEPADPRARVATIEGYQEVAHAAQWVRNWPVANDALEKAYRLAEAWIDAEPNNRQAQIVLTTSLDLIASQARSRGDLTASRDALKRALELQRALLATESDVDTARRDLLVLENNFADICFELGDVSSAKAHVDAALVLARDRLDHDVQDVQRELDLIDVLYGRGSVDDHELRPEAAIPFYREARDRLERLRTAGKLAGRPMYGEERMGMVNERLAFCERLPGVVADLNAAWREPNPLAYRLASARVVLLLRSGRTAEAAATADALCNRHPESPDDHYVLAEACVRAAAAIQPADTAAAARSIDRTLLALSQAVDGRCARLTATALEQDPAWALVRDDPRFAAVIARLHKQANGK